MRLYLTWTALSTAAPQIIAVDGKIARGGMCLKSTSQNLRAEYQASRLEKPMMLRCSNSGMCFFSCSSILSCVPISPDTPLFAGSMHAVDPSAPDIVLPSQARYMEIILVDSACAMALDGDGVDIVHLVCRALSE